MKRKGGGCMASLYLEAVPAQAQNKKIKNETPIYQV
jgi:hypothetical protein